MFLQEKRIEKMNMSQCNPKTQDSGCTSCCQGGETPRRHKLLVTTSGACLAIGILLGWIYRGSPLLERTLYLLSVVAGASLILPNAWRSVKALKLDMNVLMTVAVLGAIAISQYAEAATVVFLFSLAELLEGLSLERARRSMQSLLKLVPETALVKKDGSIVETPVDQIQVGDIILVRSGSRVPLDGVIVSGQSTLNQAPITGESIPIDKKRGDKVLASSINGEGALEIQVTHAYSDTKLAQIIRLVEEAQEQKAPIQRFVDRFAAYYTPTVFILSVAIMTIPTLFFQQEFQPWFYRGLVLLVIACPCALVIATPVSVVSGLTAMAKKGILIKGGAVLETIGRLKTLAVDKTGTITEGSPRVLHIESMNGNAEDKILTIAASINMNSPHPLAKAIVAEAQMRNLKFSAATDYQSISGRGAEGTIDDHLYMVGNHRFAHEQNLCSEAVEHRLEALEEQALSIVVVGHRAHHDCTGELIGILGLGDTVRSDASQAVVELKKAGIQEVIMLSGDNQKTVDAISKQVGIDTAYGDLLPNDKVLKIKALKDRFGSIGMVGDGVNDAPAMATATLGIAMGASGADTAIETSDMTLMHDRLLGVVDAIRMGKRTLHMIWFNTAFALGTKLLFLVLATLGYTSLWLAIAADTGATLIVIGNALRLLR